LKVSANLGAHRLLCSVQHRSTTGCRVEDSNLIPRVVGDGAGKGGLPSRKLR